MNTPARRSPGTAHSVRTLLLDIAAPLALFYGLRSAGVGDVPAYTPRHNGKVERYNRILAEEFLYARVMRWWRAPRRTVAKSWAR